MCDHCGCSDLTAHDHHDGPVHGHDHHDDHGPVTPTSARDARRILRLSHDLLAKNRRIAGENRKRLRERRIVAVNVVASPGAGKTTLLERTIRDLGREFPISIIEADPATDRDAERLRALGCRVVQLNTGTGCHLDAEMVRRGLEELRPETDSLLFLENVGNLVCPALFDLGEARRAVVASLPEGEDKPIKYPHIFRSSDAMVLNKIDLLPHLEFELAACRRFAREVKPDIVILEVSATRGDGMAGWYEWLRSSRQSVAAEMV